MVTTDQPAVRAKNNEKWRVRLYRSPVVTIAIVATLIVAAEAVESFVFVFVTPHTFMGKFYVDVALMFVLLAPAVILFVYRPLTRHISERKRVEEELRESEELYRRIVTTAQEGIWMVNAELRTEFVNQRMAEMLGYTVEEMRARSAFDFMDAATRLEAEKRLPLVPQQIRERLEFRFLCKDGSVLWAIISTNPLFNGSGTFIGVLGMLTDITERKQMEEALKQYGDSLESIVDERTLELREAVRGLQREVVERRRAEEALMESEERFRQIFEHTEDAIILFKSGTCEIIDVNPMAERLYGCTKDEFLTSGLRCFCAPAEYDAFSRAVCGAGREEGIRIDSMGNVRKDGTGIIVSVRGKMIRLREKEVVFCTFRDITERVRLEEEAKVIQAKLIHTNKMASLGVLVSGVAHEINNPNSFIMANSQLLVKAWKDIYPILNEYCLDNGVLSVGGMPFAELKESWPNLCEGITEGSRRINDIIKNLKAFSRQESYALNNKVDINRVVSDSSVILNYLINRHTKNFHMELAESLPPVKGNAQQLEQVVINLIMNALQALPDKKAGVWLSTFFDKAGFVEIKVRDAGSGMPQEILDRIVEPFFTTKLDSGGTGLGLAISSSIIKDHRGTMEFVSEPDKGTTAVIRLPVAEPISEEHNRAV